MQTVASESEVGAVNVAIAIGNEILGRGIEAVLGSLPAVATVRRCTRPEELGALLSTSGAGVVDVVIVSAFETEWLANLTRRSAEAAGPRVLLLVDESALSDPHGYASMPVDGFLSQQDLDAGTLSDALTRCRLGEVPMPPALARALLARADDPSPRKGTRVANLTSREIEALTLLVRGLSNKQIARRLQISSHGAKRLVASIMLKLDSPNRTTAAVNAIKAGIVDYEGTVTPGAGPGGSGRPAGGAGPANRYPGAQPNARANGHTPANGVAPASDRTNGYKYGPSRPPQMVGR
jgi:two-component system nitrate/nitrite response regulator NarL